MPGTSAATQSSRCGKSPNEPSRVSATMLDTSVLSAKIWNGRRTLRCMRAGGMFDLRLRFRLRLRMRFGRGFGRRLGGGLQLRLGVGFELLRLPAFGFAFTSPHRILNLHATRILQRRAESNPLRSALLSLAVSCDSRIERP